MKQHNKPGIIVPRMFLILIFTCSLFQVRAQKPIYASDVFPQLNYKGLMGEVIYKSYMQVKGSPFLSGDWLPGEIYLDNGDTLSDLQIRFDFYKHQIMVYHEFLKRIILVDKNTISGFSVNMNGRNHLFNKVMDIKSKAKTSDGIFIEILSTGNVALRKIYYDEITPLATPERPFIDEFVPGVEYKLRIGDNYETVKLRKSSLTRNFSNYKAQIKHFIRKSGLKAKREEDFTKIVTFIDALYSSDQGDKTESN